MLEVISGLFGGGEVVDEVIVGFKLDNLFEVGFLGLVGETLFDCVPLLDGASFLRRNIFIMYVFV
jgi:hypothetical protein